MSQALALAPLDQVIADIKAAFTAVHTALECSHGAGFANAFIAEHRSAMLGACLASISADAQVLKPIRNLVDIQLE